MWGASPPPGDIFISIKLFRPIVLNITSLQNPCIEVCIVYLTIIFKSNENLTIKSSKMTLILMIFYHNITELVHNDHQSNIQKLFYHNYTLLEQIVLFYRRHLYNSLRVLIISIYYKPPEFL